MRKRSLTVALGTLLTATAIAVPAMAQSDSSYSYSYTTTYPSGTTTYYTPPTGMGGTGVYVRPGPYVPPPATPDPSFVPQVVPPSTAYVAPGTTTTTTTYGTTYVAPGTTYVAPGSTTYVTPGSTTTIYTTR